MESKIKELKYLTCDEMDRAWELFNKWAEVTMQERGVNPYAWKKSIRNKRKKGGNFYKYFPRISVEEGSAKFREIINNIKEKGYYGVKM